MRRAQDAFGLNTMWPSQNPFEPNTMMVGPRVVSVIGCRRVINVDRQYYASNINNLE